MKKNEYKALLKQARPFDVHTWKDCPEIRNAIGLIFHDLKTLRAASGKRVYEPDKIRWHLRMLLQDLYLAWMDSANPFVAISQKSADFSPGTRYAAIHVSYRPLKGVLDDLIQLGYVKKAKGWLDSTTGVGIVSRDVV